MYDTGQAQQRARAAPTVDVAVPRHVTAVAVAGAWYGASAAASAAPTVASSALASKRGRVLQALLLSCSGRFAMLLLREG